MKPTSLLSWLQGQRTGIHSSGWNFRGWCEEKASQEFPVCLKPNFTFTLDHVDKIFASVWSGTWIVVGTKDNKLLVWDSEQLALFKEITLPRGLSPPLPVSCGIHSLAVDPSSQILASGADNPADIALFSLPSFEPIRALSGHQDWIFGLDFISEQLLLSGSRDGSIKIWSTTTDGAVASKYADQERVRDIKFQKILRRAYSLGTGGTIKAWDIGTLTEENCVYLPERTETVCSALSPTPGIIAVGSQTQTSIIDMRAGEVGSIPSLDLDWGFEQNTAPLRS